MKDHMPTGPIANQGERPDPAGAGTPPPAPSDAGRAKGDSGGRRNRGGPGSAAPEPAAPEPSAPESSAPAPGRSAGQADPIEGPSIEAPVQAGIDWTLLAQQNPTAAAAALKAWHEAGGDPAGQPGESTSDETAARERRARVAVANATLARDLPGWSPQMAAALTDFGRRRGFSPEELSAIEDPRQVMVLHLASLGERMIAAEAQARAFAHIRPPTQLSGSGGPGDPTDRHSTEAWMAARESHLEKRRQAAWQTAPFGPRRGG